MKILAQANSLVSLNMQGRQYSSDNWFLKPISQIAQSLRSFSPIISRLVFALGIAGILILFSGGLLVTSAKSFPGDSLYPVKRAVEDLRVHLATNDEQRQEYEESYSKQRVDEVVRLLGIARVQQISFEGIVNLISDNQWIVSSIPVSIQPNTEIVSGSAGIKAIEQGMRVEVEGVTNSQSLVIANEIHLREYQFIGTVEGIGADYWQISGIKLLITSNTPIDPGIQVGDIVAVLIRSEDSGLYALAILHEEHPLNTPGSSQRLRPTPVLVDVSIPENTEEQQIIGTLDNIGSNNWVVNGQVIYVVGETDISEGIEVGNSVSVNYRIEANGSFTAIEIQNNDNGDNPGELVVQETPEAKDQVEVVNTSIDNPVDTDETEVSNQNLEREEIPEPTENELDQH
jgi:hypothetical protein